MLAFSNDYYGLIFRATQSVELFCAYEAMACKTLIIGFKPDSFDCLFPEDAMVTLKKDGSDFFSIIDFYESHPEEYNRIVNRNYELLMERHTWSNRLESMIEIIEKECFK